MNTTPTWPRSLTAVVLALGVTLLAAACAGDSAETADEIMEGFDGELANWWPDQLADPADCSLDDGVTGRDATLALALCTLPGADSIIVEACPDPSSFGPRIRHVNDSEGVIFTTHMGIRFHPVDIAEPQREDGHDPRTMLDDAKVVNDAKVVVLDTGEHLRFARAIVVAMLDADSREVDLFPVSTPSSAESETAVSETPVQVQQTQVQPVTGNSSLPPIGFEDIDYLNLFDEAPLFTEGDVARALNGLADQLEATTPQENVIINMSFGVYNCGEPPELIQDAMVRLVRQGNVRFVASAGNDETGDKVWPAAFADAAEYPQFEDHVIAVGSVTADGTTRSCFSNHGSWVASWLPGEEVRPGSSGTWSGTSFAAPQAAAMLAAGVDPTNPAMPYGNTPSPPANEHAWMVQTPAGQTQTDVNGDEFVELDGQAVLISEFESSCDPAGPYAYRAAEELPQ